jgi:hypothetical protein
MQQPLMLAVLPHAHRNSFRLSLQSRELSGDVKACL